MSWPFGKKDKNNKGPKPPKSILSTSQKIIDTVNGNQEGKENSMDEVTATFIAVGLVMFLVGIRAKIQSWVDKRKNM